jgi:CheY-like chemotaxis protein
MDDEAIVRDAVGAMLRSLGHAVEVAEEGTTAIRKYREALMSDSPFQLVILDVTVRGGMGGVETIRRLLELHPSVAAVVSSGYAQDSAVSEYLSHGFKAVLPKPFNIGNLRSVLGVLHL